MKKNKLVFTILAVFLTGMIFLVSCKDDEPDPEALTLVSLTAGDIDLNGTTSAEDVPTDVVITAVFSTDVDQNTATASNVILTNTSDNTSVETSISVSGATVTITPSADLRDGASFKVMFTTSLASVDAVNLTAAEERSFSAAGILVPDGQVAYWNFDDSDASDAEGSNDGVEVDMTYVDSRSTDAGKAAKFNGTSSIIEIANGDQLVDGANFTLSFWMQTESEGHVDADGNAKGHFVMGLGAFFGLQYEVFGGYDGSKFAIRYAATDATSGEATTVSEDMWFPSDATDNTNGGWQGWDFAKSVSAEDMAANYLKDVWTQVVYTYDGANKRGTLYYDGEKMKSFDFNLWPDGDTKRSVTGLKYGGAEPDVVNELAFGFIQSRAGTMWDAEPWGGYDIPTANHFQGMLDDIRIFHATLTADEVGALYNSEKP